MALLQSLTLFRKRLKISHSHAHRRSRRRTEVPDGARECGPCGKSSPNNEAFKMLTCATAAQDASSSVSRS
ncbi:hypothetical protein QQ045_006570 [Rhodiola kirilowii]